MSTVKENILPSYIKSLRTFSVTLAVALELLGYRYGAIKQRQDCFTELPNIVSGDNVHVVGSKAEGTATFDESDYDYMSICDDFLCADNFNMTDDLSNPAGLADSANISLYNDANRLRLLTEIDNLNPGYSKLKFACPDVLQNMSDTHSVKEFSVEHGYHVYLSSALFKDFLTHNLLSRGVEIAGPSTRNTRGEIDIDGVFAIPYRCSILSQEWLARPRFHGWPSQQHLMDLKKLDWHLVPVGPQKDSILEWRICFTLGEQYLVKTFNITQLHLLILLKKIMNKSLKPLCKAFSSYTAKNLVFWMVEILAPENFKVEKLSSLLMMSLQMLRVAVENEQLQNYMIPSRNLLKGKIFPDEKENMITLLDSFIAYGPAFLTKEFSELQEAMQKVHNDTDLAQQVHKRYTDDKNRSDNFLDCLKKEVKNNRCLS